MITEKDSAKLAEEWIAAWNNHDLEAIMTHYADSITFTSPFIVKINNDPMGTITSKSQLKQYFERALSLYPDLKFEPGKVLASVNSMVVYYKSINNLYAAEMMEIDSAGKVCRVVAHYCS